MKRCKYAVNEKRKRRAKGDFTISKRRNSGNKTNRIIDNEEEKFVDIEIEERKDTLYITVYNKEREVIRRVETF